MGLRRSVFAGRFRVMSPTGAELQQLWLASVHIDPRAVALELRGSRLARVLREQEERLAGDPVFSKKRPLLVVLGDFNRDSHHVDFSDIQAADAGSYRPLLPAGVPTNLSSRRQQYDNILVPESQKGMWSAAEVQPPPPGVRRNTFSDHLLVHATLKV
jgi:endonuclease/exonuclease/phosphatase family metal-dependent hydrolase